MARYGMVIDVSRCIGCYACFLACRDEHVGNDHRPVALAQPDAGQNWIDVQEQERGTFPKVKVSRIPVPCQHCADAPCVRASTDGAVYRRADGIVLIDPEKATGQRGLVSSCPYGVIFWNEGQNVAQKCTLCAHLLDDGWKEPRCVEVCPTGAIIFGDLTDPDSDLSKLHDAHRLEELRPDLGVRPLVSYLGLPRPFIAGEIVLSDKADLAAQDVIVMLHHDQQVQTTVTDNYGDFEFDRIEANTEYSLRIEHPGYRARELRLLTRTDLNVGTILLEPLSTVGSI